MTSASWRGRDLVSRAGVPGAETQRIIEFVAAVERDCNPLAVESPSATALLW
jgi:hypothetical protein